MRSIIHPDEKPLTVMFAEAPRGRVTGWAVACSTHGAMPVLTPNRPAAIRAAVAHSDHEHGGRARVVESRRPSRAARRTMAQPKPDVEEVLDRFRHRDPVELVGSDGR